MPRKSKSNHSQLCLADALKGKVDAWVKEGWEVDAWVKEGWHGVTQTTYQLLHYWFDRGEEAENQFYPAQQRAIETIIYCHEILQANHSQSTASRWQQAQEKHTSLQQY